MEQDVTATPVEAKIEELKAVAADLEGKMEKAPVIAEEIGELEQINSVDTLKKAAYYAIFAPKTQESIVGDDTFKNVHIARFESKAMLKNVIDSLEEKGFKLIDILKGRPLSFEIKTRKVTDITIGL